MRMHALAYTRTRTHTRARAPSLEQVGCFKAPLVSYVTSAAALDPPAKGGPSPEDVAAVSAVFGNVEGIHSLTNEILANLEASPEPGPTFLKHHKYVCSHRFVPVPRARHGMQCDNAPTHHLRLNSLVNSKLCACTLSHRPCGLAPTPPICISCSCRACVHVVRASRYLLLYEAYWSAFEASRETLTDLMEK